MTSTPAKLPRRGRFTRSSILRLVVASVILILQVPPMDSWDGRSWVLAAAVTVVTVDYLWSARVRGPLYLALGLYTAFVVGGIFLTEIVQAPRAWLIATTVGAVASAAAAVVVAAASVHKTRELDRLIVFEAATIGFFATMLAVITYAIVESWLAIPQISAWAYVGVGGAAYGLAFLYLTRRYA